MEEIFIFFNYFNVKTIGFNEAEQLYEKGYTIGKILNLLQKDLVNLLYFDKKKADKLVDELYILNKKLNFVELAIYLQCFPSFPKEILIECEKRIEIDEELGIIVIEIEKIIGQDCKNLFLNNLEYFKAWLYKNKFSFSYFFKNV